MARDFTTVGVVGLGTMGAGIVEVFAREGLQVVGLEPTEEALERGRGHLRNSTDRAVRRGKLTESDRDDLVARVRFSTSMEDLADVDLLIEAVPERLDLKQEVFAAADKICRPDTVLATAVQGLVVELDADDLVAVAGEDLGDAGTHGPESDDADGGEVSRHARILPRHGRGQP